MKPNHFPLLALSAALFLLSVATPVHAGDEAKDRAVTALEGDLKADPNNAELCPIAPTARHFGGSGITSRWMRDAASGG